LSSQKEGEPVSGDESRLQQTKTPASCPFRLLRRSAMRDSVRRWGAELIGVAAILALGHQAVLGQQPAPAANSNVYVNPLASTGRFTNAAALGQSLNAPAGGSLLGYGSLTSGTGSPGLGYGSLAASYANPSLGYGSLTNNPSNSNYSNGYGAYGYGGFGGWGTQWMQNPYQGYLSGAADVTRANAEYQLTISQAKLVRQEAIRSSIQTRRAMIEELEWEREHMPDPEKIRQEGIRRELDRARHSPPLTDVWTARALNSLLRHLIAQQGRGTTGPKVALSDDVLDHINLTVGDSRGNVGLLRDSGNLRWPLPLQNEAFKEPREKINSLMQTALKSASSGTTPDTSTIFDLRSNYETLRKTLDANVDRLTPDEYIDANKYLRYVQNAITALKDPNVIQFFNNNWKARGKSVAELVQYMREKGLWFAPSTPTDEAAYVALYNALVSFDSGMQRAVSTGAGENDR
jgi:hypothetical protein